MRITFDVDGADEVSHKLLRVADNAADMSPALKGVASYIRGIAADQFRSQGRRSGGWAPLKIATVARKKARGQSKRILRATGQLEASATSRMHSQHIERVKPDELFVGTSNEKGPHHQYGAPRANVPQRQIFALKQSDRRTITKHLQEFLVDNYRGLLK